MEAPHPEWKPGMKQPRPDYIGQQDNYITLDPAELGNAGYPLVISAIAPRYQGARPVSQHAYATCQPRSTCPSAAVHLPCRPIAFIVSQDKEGQRNLRWLQTDLGMLQVWRVCLAASMHEHRCFAQPPSAAQLTSSARTCSPYSYFQIMSHDPPMVVSPKPFDCALRAACLLFSKLDQQRQGRWGPGLRS